MLAGYGLHLLGYQENAWIAEHVSQCEGCRAFLEELSINGTRPLSYPEVHAGAEPMAIAKVIGEAPATLAHMGNLSACDNTDFALSHLNHAPFGLAEHPRYRILELLGYGGMGIVYKAEHRLMERPVAVKVIHPQLVDRPGMVERFHREVKTAGRLSLPNIVHAFDAEQWGNIHFLVMELVSGQDLEKIASAAGPLPIGLACEYVRQTALVCITRSCREWSIETSSPIISW